MNENNIFGTVKKIKARLKKVMKILHRFMKAELIGQAELKLSLFNQNYFPIHFFNSKREKPE